MKIRDILIKVAVLAGIVFASATTARAAVITETYDFTLGGFVDFFGNVASPPITSITGSFTLTFDPSVGAIDQTTGIKVNSLSDTSIDTPIAFFAGPVGGSPFFISIGGNSDGAGMVLTGTNDFLLSLQFANAGSLGNPQLALCNSGGSCGDVGAGALGSIYTLTTDPESAFFATTGTVSAVPEPSTWAMMLIGFAGIGFMAYRRSRKALAA
jgi:hypothetical protein